MEKNNIHISFLEKTLLLFQRSGSITNGRDDIYDHVLSLIDGHFIFGRGIGFYQQVFDTYPHNIVLQLLLEMGFLPVLVLFFFLIAFFFFTFKDNIYDNEWECVLILLFFNSIPRLLVSSYLWQDHVFWLFLFISINVISKKYESTLLK